MDWGLPYGKLGFSTNGFLVSAENASRMESTCLCMSGMGQELMHFSNIRIWRVKYWRASEFRSGSGEVSATYVHSQYRDQVKNREYGIRHTHQMEHDACQHSVDGEVDASLHALEAHNAERVHNSFL